MAMGIFKSNFKHHMLVAGILLEIPPPHQRIKIGIPNQT